MEETHASADLVQTKPPWLRLGLLALAGLGVLFVILRSPDSNESALAGSTTIASIPSAPVESTIVTPGTTDAGSSAASAAAPLEPIFGAETPPEIVRPGAVVRAVVGSPIGEDPRLLTWSPLQTSDTPLPDATHWAFDAAHQLLAGRLGEPNITATPAVLVLNVNESDVDDPIQGGAIPNATSFAWHDTVPGRIAWLEPGDGTGLTTLVVGDVEMNQPDTEFPSVRERHTVPDVGALERWGSWGFAIRHDTFFFRTTVVRRDGLDEDGQPLMVTDGRVAGAVPLPAGDPGATDHILISDFDNPAFGLRPETGAMVEVPWLELGDRVSALDTSPTNRHHHIMQITRNGFGGLSAGRVIEVRDGLRVEGSDWAAPAPTPLSWDSTGSFAVYATQGATVPRPGVSLYTVGFAEPPLPYVAELDAQAWVAALAVD